MLELVSVNVVGVILLYGVQQFNGVFNEQIIVREIEQLPGNLHRGPIQEYLITVPSAEIVEILTNM